MDYVPQPVPSTTAAELRQWLDTEHRRIALAFADLRDTMPTGFDPSLPQTITGAWTFANDPASGPGTVFTASGGGRDAAIQVKAVQAGINLWSLDPANSVDEHSWDIVAGNDRFDIRTINDANSAVDYVLSATRNGYNVTRTQLSGDVVELIPNGASALVASPNLLQVAPNTRLNIAGTGVAIEGNTSVANANNFFVDGYARLALGTGDRFMTNVPESPDNANGIISYESHPGGYGFQLYNPDTGRLWWRQHSSGSWTGWQRLVSTTEATGVQFVQGPTWTSNGWLRALTIYSSSMITFGNFSTPTGDKFGLGESGGTLYLGLADENAAATGIDQYILRIRRDLITLASQTEVLGPLITNPNGGGCILNTTGTAFLYGIANDNIGDCYMGFLESDRSTRKGYFGYDSSSTDVMTLVNEENSELQLNTGGGAVRIYSASQERVTATTSGVAFNGMTPAARPDYTITGTPNDRTINAAGTSETLATVSNCLATLIQDLINIGLLQ